MHSIGMDVDRTFEVLIEQDEDGWFVAHVPAMPGCHTQGKTRKQALERIKEAILLWLESGDTPREGVHFVGMEKVTVEA
jgi:predicted RNase H-like HicB family nuclease